MPESGIKEYRVYLSIALLIFGNYIPEQILNIIHCKYHGCNFSGFQTCSNPSCTPVVVCTSDSQVQLRDVNQVQYICQFVFLTTTTCIHQTDVLRVQSDGTFAGYSSNFCWLEQQYWQFTAATFMNFSCTLDTIRKCTKSLDRIQTHTRF